jgi:hypothetical protein
MTNRGGGRCRGAKVSRRRKVESTLGQVANTANTENMKTTAAIQGQKGNRGRASLAGANHATFIELVQKTLTRLRCMIGARALNSENIENSRSDYWEFRGKNCDRE